MAERVEYELSLKDLLSGKLAAVESEAKNVDSVMGSLQSTAIKVGATIAAAFAITKVKDFAMSVVDAGSTVENATTGLTTLLKDSASAAEVVQNTMQDATKTPFAFEGLLAANKALISAGDSAGEARTDVLNLANAIAATGGGDVELQRMVVNLQQIKNTGKATAQDIKQFAFAGINVYKVLADATGQPISKVKDMEVSYHLLTSALAKAHAQGGIYYNGLENMSGNTSVQISNLGDAIFQLKNKMFTDLKSAISSVISGMGTFIGYLRQGWEWSVKNKEAIGLVASVVAGAAVAYGIYTLAVSSSTIATTLWTGAQWLLNAALSANPIGVVVVAIGALTGAIIYAWRNFVGFRAVVVGVWGVLKEFASIVADVFTGVWKIISGVQTFNVDKINSGAAQAASAMYDAGKRMSAAYKAGYDTTIAEDNKQKGVLGAGAITGTKKQTGVTPTPEDAAKVSPKSATGQKITTINISIGKLIETFKVQTTNMQESSAKVRELVAQTLLSAVNDSQIVSGI